MSKFDPKKWTTEHDGHIYSFKQFNGKHYVRKVMSSQGKQLITEKAGMISPLDKNFPNSVLKEIRANSKNNTNITKVVSFYKNDSIVKGLFDVIEREFTYESINFLIKNKDDWFIGGVEIVKSRNNPIRENIDWNNIKDDLINKLTKYLNYDKMLEKDVMYSDKHSPRTITFDLEEIRSEFLEKDKPEALRIPVKVGSVLISVNFLPTEKLIDELYDEMYEADYELNYGVIKKNKSKKKTSKKTKK